MKCAITNSSVPIANIWGAATSIKLCRLLGSGKLATRMKVSNMSEPDRP
ncbi:MAG: hypothetical protein KC427_09625 [Sulfurovum sp.]|nr:hypothetical protein [Sulfurovum sp.]MCO4846264.1 hypothetical protein [Sulfurovum sp.]